LLVIHRIVMSTREWEDLNAHKMNFRTSTFPDPYETDESEVRLYEVGRVKLLD